MPDWFRLDRTEGQEHALYVAAEKDTLRQQLTGWLSDLGIPVLVVRGFGSQSYADVVRERTAHQHREAHLAYIGDLDASGMDTERDWVARTGCWSRTERVLLTYDQVHAYGLPATESKRGDPRRSAFACRYGFDPRRPVQREGRPWSRPSSSAWSSPPSPCTPTVTSSPGRPPTRKSNAAPSPPSWRDGTRWAGERRRSTGRTSDGGPWLSVAAGEAGAHRQG
ncbi:hypothetical protein [Streptomyces syringium]|uniref:hypothetical protein n=1 Tax=Streptomyces syringium TaxID=76729 RepID=UPI003424480E